MDVEVALEMGFADFHRIVFIEPVLGGDHRRDVVVQPLDGKGHVAVFVDAPVEFTQIGIHDIGADVRLDVADSGVLVPVKDIGDYPMGKIDRQIARLIAK